MHTYDIWHEPLTKKTFLLYAASHYKHGKSTWVDFYEDVKTISKLAKSLQQYIGKGVTDKSKARCILNYVITLANVFDDDALARILFFKLSEDLHSVVKPMLGFIFRLPDSIPECKLSDIEDDDIIIRTLGLSRA